ncbi:MAG: hypothetical protein HRF49_05770 [bacterium]|jgi:pyrroloquinoline-quinone synthase
MKLKDRLDAIVARYNLLGHPFYKAWSAGTLPESALKTYAEEYGQLVRLMPQAWLTLGDDETVREEEEHSELWDCFATALGCAVGDSASIAEVESLVDTAERLFSHPLSCAGALYAFEVQQPETAKSKLEGLLKHFPQVNPELALPYFEAHSHNHHECEKLLKRMEGASLVEEAEYEQACEEMSAALWNALSGIYGKHCRASA